MKKPKILITASTFPRFAGDTEPHFILDLAKALLEYCDVTVLAPSSPESKANEVMEGVKVIRYRYFPIKKWKHYAIRGQLYRG